MSDLGTRAPKPKRERLGSSFRTSLTPITVEGETSTPEHAADLEPAAKPLAFTARATETADVPAASRKARTKKTTPASLRNVEIPEAHALENTSAATVGVTIRLDEPLRKRMDAHKAEVQLSYPTLVMVAVQASYPRMRELLAARQTSLGIDEDAPNLFGLPVAVSQHSANAAGPKQSLPFKVSPERKAVLDQLVHQFNAQSLNELIVTALDDWLPRPV